MPIGWSSVTFAAMFDRLQYGLTASASPRSAGVRFLRITDLNTRHIDWTNVPGLDHVDDLERYFLKHGDFVFARSGSIEKAARVSDPPSAVFASYLIRGTPSEETSDWLAAFIRSELYLIQVRERAAGIGLANVNASKLATIEVPIAPAAEQRRIVAKIDSLSAKSSRARDHLDHIPRLVEKFKAAVFAAAFLGELTRSWRVEREITTKGKMLTIKDVARIASGQTPKDIETALDPVGEVPWFKVSSMNMPDNRDGLQVSDFRMSRENAARLGLRLQPVGSIVFPKRGGAIATNKKRRLLVPGALDLNLMVLKATNVRDEYLWHWLQSLDLASISNGSNVPQINNGDIEPLPILVPSEEEQGEIVDRLNTAIGWIDRLAAQATSARTLVDRLDQAVLAKAFRGELVPQNPADEPATALLARINAERGDFTTPKRRGRKLRAV